MNLILVTLMATVAGIASLQEAIAGADQVPALESGEVIAILVFEIEGLADGDVEVQQIKQLHERAKAYVKIGGRSAIVILNCRKTDFGPRWGLAGNIADSIIYTSTAEGSDQATEEQVSVESGQEADLRPGADEAPDSALPTEELSEYQQFLIDFVTALREGRSESYTDFFFRDDDFNLETADEPLAEALAELRRQRREFLNRCAELSRELSRYRDYSIVDISVTGVPPDALEHVRVLLPTVVEFYSTATISIELDGAGGTITLEAVTKVGTGWRVGTVSDFLFPPAPEPESNP